MTHASVLAANPGFEPPTTWEFVFTPGNVLLWKSSFLLVLAGVVVAVFFLASSARAPWSRASSSSPVSRPTGGSATTSAGT